MKEIQAFSKEKNKIIHEKNTQQILVDCISQIFLGINYKNMSENDLITKLSNCKGLYSVNEDIIKEYLVKFTRIFPYWFKLIEHSELGKLYKVVDNSSKIRIQVNKDLNDMCNDN